MTTKDWLSPKVENRNSTISGKGLFAREDIGRGETLVIWKGEYTDSKGAEKARKKGKLAMQWDEDLFSVEDRGDDEGYFINHSCDPNLWMIEPNSLISRREIKKGEELTADYALWEADEKFVSPWICKCGSVNCRGKITGTDWRKPKLQDLYWGHFSPLINHRIGKLLPQNFNRVDPKLQKVFKQIWELALPYQDARDDAGHARVVTMYAIAICGNENTDANVVVPAAILHDIGWSQLNEDERMLIFNKDNPKELRLKMRYRHQEEGVKLAKEILKKVQYPKKYINEILEIISEHDTREGFTSANEGAMRDADKLWRFDAYGFLDDNKNSQITYKRHLKALGEYFENPNFFYFQSSETLAKELLLQLKKDYL